MLSTGGTFYLMGHDPLGAWDGSAWVYHLPDALGSARDRGAERGRTHSQYDGAQRWRTDGTHGQAGGGRDPGAVSDAYEITSPILASLRRPAVQEESQ